LAGSFARGFGPAQRGHKSFSWSSVRPLVDGSNRVDNFPGRGGATISSKKEQVESTHALIFLHGYNVTFRHAAIRAAQLHVDLNVNGATAFFSWPSKGRFISYLADGSTIEASELAISKFLVDFCGRSGADHVHIVAHSMGNRGLLRSLQRITADATSKSAVKLCQVFLAAPDIDREVFSWSITSICRAL
jgi:esterase/lipase superfamily enzyme